MYCTKCGAYIPDGETYCVACGTNHVSTQNSSQTQNETQEQPQKSVNDILFGGMQYDDVQSHYQSNNNKKSTNKTAKTIGIIATVLIVGVLFYLLSGVTHWGKYELETISAGGMEVNLNEYSDMVGQTYSLEFRLTLGRCYVDGNVPGVSLDGDSYYKASYFGNKITLKDKNGEKLEAKFEGKYLIVEYGGYKYKFKKK